MKNKTLSLLTLSVLSTLILISCVSAIGNLTITDVASPASVLEDTGSFTLTFNLTYDGDVENQSINFDASTISLGTISIPETTMNEDDSDDGDSKLITATITLPANHGGETLTGVINATDSIDTESATFSISITEIVVPPVTCEGVSDGSMDLTIEDITVTEGFGDDDEWLLLDEIEVEINVENSNDDEKIKDVKVEWGLYDEGADDWAIKMDDEPDFDIKKDDDKTITVNFKIDEKDLDVNFDELEGDYTLYVKATGEEQGDPDVEVCAIDSEPVRIEIESDFVMLDNIETLETVSCGADLQITADVWNIGDDDQEGVYVVLENEELRVTQVIEIGDVDAFKDENLDVTVTIPQDVESKSYNFFLKVFNEDNDLYENDYDDDPSVFRVSVNVEGGCSTESSAVVSASLESGGKAGEDLVIRATITNTADGLATFLVTPVGYAGWASSAEVDSEIIVVDAGESKDVLITFRVNEDAQGEQSFNLEVLSDGEIVINQPVSVTIEGKKGFSLTGSIINEGNWHLWGIGFLNIVLVIIIIVVALRVARSN